ncbi:MAG TPA: protein kinase [Kofleriaceae bacterium]|jgi:predicted Ser/Thr protein kinase
MDPASQQLGEFRIGGVLGEGGSGVVYDARWGPRRVALKVLHAALVRTGKERAQFLAEAQRLQQIAHASVVKVLASGELPDGRPYLAMERLDGETLAKVIARGPLAVAHALALFDELCSAVAALHEQGLVHRDLKPENVFVVGGEHAVLLDFGIAKDLAAPASTTTQEGHVRGTPMYMAPERFFGQAAGIATDVYELALVLYAMLAARLPWDDHADPEARLAPRPFGDLGIAVPAALDAEVRRALSTRAQNRPASARALAEAVRAAAGDCAAAEEPASTARMRPASEGSEGERTAGEHAPTGALPSEQQTPLAWAPTARAPATGSKKRPWVMGAIAVGLAGAVAGGVWKASTTTSTTTSTSASAETGTGKGKGIGKRGADAATLANDPWNTPEPVIEALPLVEPKLSIETYRAELAAAVARLPADTRFVAAIELSELRQQRQVADMLGKLPKDPRVAMLSGMLPPCVRELLGNAEWIAFGSPTADDSIHGTLVVRGRWRRASVEECLSGTAKPHATSDHATVFQLGDDGWLDFVDEHTVYMAARGDLTADAIHALVKHGAGPQPHARELLARQPADRAVAVVLDGHGNDDLSGTLGLPKGTDLAGWVRVDADGLSLDLAADPHDAAIAKRAADKMRPQLDALFASAPPDAIGKLQVAVEHTAVHVRGRLSTLMLNLVAGAI